YFPGWRATVNGEPVPVEPVGPLGLIRVTVPAGRQDLVVWFGDTPVRTIASVVSVISDLILLGALARGFGLRRTLVVGVLAALGRTPTGKGLLGALVPARLSVVVPRSTPAGRCRLLAGLRIGAWTRSVPVGEIDVR